MYAGALVPAGLSSTEPGYQLIGLRLQASNLRAAPPPLRLDIVTSCDPCFTKCLTRMCSNKRCARGLAKLPTGTESVQLTKAARQ